MDINAVENDIIAKLKADILTNVPEIRAFPDNVDNYIKQLKRRNGAILVNLQGATWEAPVPNNQKVLTQLATYSWQCTIIKKNLSREKQHVGAEDLVDIIRTSLSGYTPASLADSSILWPVDAGFISEKHGFYVYQISMAHQIEESET